MRHVLVLEIEHARLHDLQSLVYDMQGGVDTLGGTFGNIADHAALLSEPQGLEGLVAVAVVFTGVDDDWGSAVAPEAVLQQVRQFAVLVGHVFVVADETADALAQTE